MRILAVIVNLVPYHIARWTAVTKVGHEVVLLQRRSGDPFAVLGTSADHLSFEVQTLNQQVPLYDQLDDAIDRVMPDVIVISGYSFAESLAALLVANHRSLPVVVCSESNRHDAPRRWPAEVVKSRILHFAQAGLAGGEPQAAYLEQLGMSPDAIFRGYNAVDNHHFSTAFRWRAMGPGVRSALNLPKSYLLAVSRFTQKKNLAMLIDGFALWRSQLSESVDDLHLLILGDGPLRSDLEAQVEALGLKNHVLLPGASDYSELPSRYGLAEAFIHASSVEQWGLVVNEAMAAGLPVLVSSACGCVPQLVHPGINGFRFDPRSSSSIAAVITQFVNLQPIQRRRMGQASRRLVSGFGPEAFAAGLTAAVEHASQQNVEQMSRIDQVLIKRLMTRSADSV